ncbi:MAG: M20 family metallopeptidase [Clostridia bacterium]|nr:M20 family metallopeptidase [Clostridia bacterium]
MDIKQICSLVDDRKEELFELLSSLVRINSESFGSYGNEEECARYVDKIYKQLGLESDLYSPMDIENFENHPDYMPGRNLENRYNVVGRWAGEENVDELMIMAHSDTVKIGDLSNWDDEPLSGVIKDGKIYGRGAGDDKYAIATGIFVVKLLKELGFKPKKNLLLAAYSDEEYGGSHGALAAVTKYPCNIIVSADGRKDQIWHCGSGGGELKYNFHTKDIADSAKSAALAIPVVLEVIDKFAQNRRKELEENRFYKGTVIPQTSLRYMGVKAGDAGADLGMGEAHFVFYTDKSKEEIYAELAELEKELAQRLDPLGIIGDGFKPATRFFHYVFTEPDSEEIKLMVEASKEAIGIEPLVCGSCLSDYSVISKYGTSHSFAYGAGRSFEKKGGAHQPNEYIACDKLVEYAKCIATYIVKVLG